MRRFALLCAVLLVAGGVAPAAAVGGAAARQSSTSTSAAASAASTPSNATGAPVCAGRVSQPANGVTVVSVQGARFGEEGGKTAARLVAYGPRGGILWVHHSGRKHGVVWSYDVDPLPNGNVFVTGTQRGTTVLYELNATTGETVWRDELPFVDTHDADPLNRTHVVVANMRNPDIANGTNDDRIVVYNRETDEITWTWRFDPRYPASVGGNYSEDWTHVNDVDAVNPDGEGDRATHFLVSPRNFDQVLLVNRSTGDVELKLGSDGDYDTMKRQHNPDFLRSDAGNPTVVVADSENDRVVEYAKRGGEWTQTWRVGSSDSLSWPRDADRLRNGHTLLGDSRNNRVLEVTPRGRVVWEVYAPWLVYDAERVPAAGFDADGYRDVGGSRGPTMADIGGGGTYALSNATPPETAALESCAAAITTHDGGFRSLATATPGGDGDERTVTAATPVPSQTSTTIAGFGAAVAAAAVLVAALLGRRRA
ncbi:aryl-sulfate sulfotransferase [Halobaculum sp. P14]|uniref:aryl-sulfate sulfotransferase n=1 Tax=Halobaculum sp. P14 TaxID=3421638 RepID=UPI003EC12372